jgi:hypothetical protein
MSSAFLAHLQSELDTLRASGLFKADARCSTCAPTTTSA